MIRRLIILLLLSLSYTADHLLLIQVVTLPDAAESFSIYNPTDSPIDLTNYYICDDEEYYNISIYPDSMFSSKSSGYTAKFPDTFIAPGDTFHIVLNENYSEFYGEDFVPDIVMFASDEKSMLDTKIHTCSAGPNAGNPCEVNEDCPNNDGDGVANPGESADLLINISNISMELDTQDINIVITSNSDEISFPSGNDFQISPGLDNGQNQHISVPISIDSDIPLGDVSFTINLIASSYISFEFDRIISFALTNNFFETS